MEVEHNAVRVEATKAPTCELMRGPMLLSKAPASLPLLHFYQGREHTLGYRSHMLHAYVPWDAKAHRSLHLKYSSPHVSFCTHTSAQQTEVKDSMAPKTAIKQRRK